MLSPISKPSKFASMKAGIDETGEIISTSRLTTLITPPCFNPLHKFSLMNLTGIATVTFVSFPILKKSTCKMVSFTG